MKCLTLSRFLLVWMLLVGGVANGLAQTAVITSISPSSGTSGTAIVTINVTNLIPFIRVNNNNMNVQDLVPYQVGNSSFSLFLPASTVLANGIYNGPITIPLPTGLPVGPVGIYVRSATPPNGSVSNVISFNITAPPPIITSFTPDIAPAGSIVTITGTNFTGTTEVRFGNFGGVAATFTVNSATQIIATVPALAATGPISIVTPSGTATSASDFRVIIPAPTITSFTPTSGAVGTSVAINGTRLNTATAVRFGGVPATFMVNSATQITATVPSGAVTGLINIVTPSITVISALNFIVTIPAPAITTFTPTSAMVGASVVITGTNFTGATAVAFSGVPTTFTVLSPTQITATVPAGAVAGPISVTTPSGTAISETNFTVPGPLPTITNFTPTSGIVGSSVVITGTGFTGMTAVRFGSINATFTVNSANQITATVPSGAVTAPIVVVAAGGMAVSGMPFMITTPPLPAPTVSRISISEGGTGTRVSITGTGFRVPMTVMLAARREGGAVRGVACSSVNILSSTSLEAIVGFDAASATGEVVVQTPSGASPAAPSVLFDYIAPPVITSVSPSAGNTGDRITIQGLNFVHPRRNEVVLSAVRLGGRATSAFNVFGTSSILCTVGDGATGRVVVENILGAVNAENVLFTFGSSPFITGFTPSSGPIGTEVTISGTNLSGASAVYFGGVAVTSVRAISASQIQVTVPTGAVTGLIGAAIGTQTARSVGNFTVESGLAAPILMPAAIIANAPTIRTLIFVQHRWEAVSGATTYRIVIANNAAFTDVTDNFLYSSTILPIFYPNPNTTTKQYYWRVRAESGSLVSPWSVGRVTINPTPQIASVSPSWGTPGNTVNVNIQGIMTDFTRVSRIVLRQGTASITGVISSSRTPTAMSVMFAIPFSAPAGNYTLIVSDPSGNISRFFTINPLNIDSGLEPSVSNNFNPRVHGFAFSNSAGSIWPPVRPIDYTSAIFPDIIREAARRGDITTNKWYSFEDNITRLSVFYREPTLSMNDGLNYTGTLREVPSMITRAWIDGVSGVNLGVWPGSCHGFSMVALLNYAGYPAYQFSTSPFTVSGASLRNENLQRLINRQTFPQHFESTDSPNDVVQLLRTTLGNPDRTAQRVMYVTVMTPLDHVVVPYRLITARSALNRIVDSIFVYDPNQPGDTNAVVIVDRSANTANYNGQAGGGSNVIKLGLPINNSLYSKFTRPFTDILVAHKNGIGTLSDEDSTSLRREVTFPLFAGGNGYTTPSVMLRSQWNQSISSSGPFPSPTWLSAEPIREIGGLAPNFFNVVRGFSMSANSEATLLTAEYQPVETIQTPIAKQTQTLSFSDPNFAMYTTWQVATANPAKYRVITNINTSTVQFVAPLPASAVDMTISCTLVGSQTFARPSARLWNTTVAANDSLSLQMDNPNRRVIVTSFAGKRSYNIDFEFGSQGRKFATIPIASEETHIYSLDDWTQLSATNLTLTSRTITDIGAVVEKKVDIRPFTTTSVPAHFEALETRIFPNPAQNIVSVEFGVKTAERITVRLSNVLGTILIEQSETAQAGAYSTSLDVSDLAAGVYFVRVQAGSAAWVEKIVKQ